jgi:hypothetical protein
MPTSVLTRAELTDNQGVIKNLVDNTRDCHFLLGKLTAANATLLDEIDMPSTEAQVHARELAMDGLEVAITQLEAAITAIRTSTCAVLHLRV